MINMHISKNRNCNSRVYSKRAIYRIDVRIKIKPITLLLLSLVILSCLISIEVRLSCSVFAKSNYVLITCCKKKNSSKISSPKSNEHAFT